MNLVIVESPNKCKSIESYLGENYKVVATGGHIRELSTKGFGFNLETLEMRWQFIETPGKSKKQTKQEIVQEIKRYANLADNVYLATDPDREGEAISWHVFDLLDKDAQNKSKRITFNEVTKKAIINAIENKSEIDIHLVNSQFARQIIDRLVGFKLSSLTRSKLKAQSAGRVQSIALLFVVQRELERRNFVKEDWFEIKTILKNNLELNLLKIKYNLTLYKPEDSNVVRFINKQDAQKVFDDLSDVFTIIELSKPKVNNGERLLALTTDKLLQYAANNLGWTASKITKVAQTMFEGLEINQEFQALITYPRTDSERLSDEFVAQAHTYINDHFGTDDINTQVNYKTAKQTQNTQDAHEAIRPVNIFVTPEQIKDHVPSDVYKLYNLIWTRTLASLMNPPSFVRQEIFFDNNGHTFHSAIRSINTLGYWKLNFYTPARNEMPTQLMNLKVNDKFTKKEMEIISKETLPPPYYTEASLINALKKAGVGRPSTYVSMVNVGLKRGYVQKDKNKLIPTDLGMLVIAELTKAFPEVISISFTSNMEETLDEIALGKLEWKKPLHEFIPKFEENVQNAYKIIDKVEDEKTGKQCPVCESDLVIKTAKKYRKDFIGCSNFPTCKYIEQKNAPEIIDEECPECHNSPLVKRVAHRTGKPFIGCNNFPKCKYIRNYEVKKEEK
ncbi:type I DNA topoisomerase [Ureaplasma miroungigenitalium]|uniref:type I DNA topoisomerase n=1 Tax=Ureaplasma miroungigenitalium TaxID=1042321 RepID=UPI0021E90698|nr:type I DNA topoisomerase [Ureaplasma miroungigenitalium]MCV3734476.1 type I DNA topoisomerase [Ureaplasma miroungigenitalium]